MLVEKKTNDTRRKRVVKITIRYSGEFFQIKLTNGMLCMYVFVLKDARSVSLYP